MTTAYRSSTETPAVPSSTFSPIAMVGSLFPRHHPSASTVRLLGLLALATGPLAGVPAILLGHIVEREVASSNGRLVGPAGLFVYLGWTGTWAGTFLTLYLAASSSAAFALTLVAIGAAVAVALVIGSTARAPSFLSTLTGLVRRAPVLASVPIAGVLLTGAAGYATKRSADERARIEAAARCTHSLRDADAAVAENRFDHGRALLATARSTCVGAALDVVSSRAATLAEREAAELKHQEEEAAARRAREAEEAARQAQRRRADEEKHADAQIQKAETLAGQRQWEAADVELQGAEQGIANLRFLHAAKEVVERLSKRTATVRERITPGLDQLRKIREAQEAAEERRRAAREAAAARESARVLMCRDGSVSGCPCAGSHRGCCSRHGGVAGCQ